MRYGKLLIRIMFVFSLFLGGSVVFTSSQALAFMCCPCGVCQQGCTCPGVGWCFWCAAPSNDSETDFVPSMSEGPRAEINIRGVRGAVLYSATERMLSDIDRNYGRERVALRLLENSENRIKLWCPQTAKKNVQNNPLAFQVQSDIKE